MVGDATTYGKDSEWNRFRQMFEEGEQLLGPNGGRIPLYVGLGNHDTANNEVSCYDWGVDGTTCARRSYQIMRQTAAGRTVGSKLFRWATRTQVVQSLSEIDCAPNTVRGEGMHGQYTESGCNQ